MCAEQRLLRCHGLRHDAITGGPGAASATRQPNKSLISGLIFWDSSMRKVCCKQITANFGFALTHLSAPFPPSLPLSASPWTSGVWTTGRTTSGAGGGSSGTPSAPPTWTWPASPCRSTVSWPPSPWNQRFVFFSVCPNSNFWELKNSRPSLYDFFFLAPF